MQMSAAALALLCVSSLVACGGGGSGSSGRTSGPTASPPPAPDESGTVTLAITDGPMEDATELVIRLTHVDFGHADGDVTRLQLHDGPLDLDMMTLQNGVTHDLLDHVEMPAGDYRWMELGLDLDSSHIGLQAGARHRLGLGDPEAMRVHEPFTIRAGEYNEFVMDFDLRNGVRHHHMGGMMGSRFELHHGLRLMATEDAGGLAGVVADALIDVNHPDCDPAPGGNWAYLFPGDAAAPDDLAETDGDGHDGPIATDRVELHHGLGEYRYHFGFIPAGNYRVGFTCAGDWDEAGDDDYPEDPDRRFNFQAFSDPIMVVAGQTTVFDLSQ